MLPFLKPRNVASAVIERRKLDNEGESKPIEQNHPELLKLSEDLIKAMHAKDAQAVADSLKAAHAHLSKSPENENEAE